MKAFTLLFTTLFVPTITSAQDIITKRNGDEIQAKIIEVSDTDIRYKKWSNPDGPSYTMKTADIFMIKYQNGDKDVFKDVPAEETTSKMSNEPETQSLQILTTEMLTGNCKNQNDELIAAINITPSYKPQKSKKGGSARFVFNAEENSVLCNEDISISLVAGGFNRDRKKSPVYFDPKRHYNCPGIQVLVKNTSNKTLYIDLGNSFFVRNGRSECYYKPTATSTMKSGSSGTSVNLGAVAGALGVGGSLGTLAGGINVGGGSTSGTTTTTYSQRVVAIPAKGEYAMEAQYLNTSKPLAGSPEDAGYPGLYYARTVGYEAWMEINYFRIQQSKDKPLMNGEEFEFSKDNTPLKFSVVVSYSEHENCQKGYTLPINIYVNKMIVGIPEFTTEPPIYIVTEVKHGKFDDFTKSAR